MMKFLHAIAAVFTVLVFLMRGRSRAARLGAAKRSSSELFPRSHGDSRASVRTRNAPTTAAFIMPLPRYKRDPVIEEFVVPPSD